MLHGQRVWDAAQQVLARQEGFVRTKALLANARPPARVAERLDEDEVSQTHIIDSVGRQQGVSYSELLSADGDAASVFFRC